MKWWMTSTTNHFLEHCQIHLFVTPAFVMHDSPHCCTCTIIRRTYLFYIMYIHIILHTIPPTNITSAKWRLGRVLPSEIPSTESDGLTSVGAATASPLSCHAEGYRTRGAFAGDLWMRWGNGMVKQRGASKVSDFETRHAKQL